MGDVNCSKKCTVNCNSTTVESCIYHKPDYKYCFWKQDFAIGQDFTHHILRYDVLMILMEGSVEVMIDGHTSILKEKEMIILPLFSVITTRTLTPVKVISLTLDSNSYSICLSRVMTNEEIVPRSENLFSKPLRLTSEFENFIGQLSFYLKHIPYCRLISDNKITELSMLFYIAYCKEDLIGLFKPLFRPNYEFVAKINKNLDYFISVEDMAQRLNMSVSVFNRTFKSVFAESPYKWLLKQKARVILQYISLHKCSICDIIDMYNFTSPSHFHRFCVSQYECTPAALFKRVKSLQ